MLAVLSVAVLGLADAPAEAAQVISVIYPTDRPQYGQGVAMALAFSTMAALDKPDVAEKLQKELDGRESVYLTEEVREDIHLALPAHPRCDAEGKKTCPARFSQAPGDASQPPGNAPWGVLDGLKTEKRQK